MTQRRLPAPPRGLSPRARRLWAYVTASWVLEEHHLAILRAACEAQTRGDQARAVLRKEGPIYYDRFNTPRRHPAVMVEENSRIQFLRAMRELNLDESALTAKRPPRGRGRRA